MLKSSLECGAVPKLQADLRLVKQGQILPGSLEVGAEMVGLCVCGSHVSRLTLRSPRARTRPVWASQATRWKTKKTPPKKNQQNNASF